MSLLVVRRIYFYSVPPQKHMTHIGQEEFQAGCFQEGLVCCGNISSV